MANTDYTTQAEKETPSTGYQSDPTTVWSEKRYTPWKNPVDRKNGRIAKKRAIRTWRRKQRAQR